MLANLWRLLVALCDLRAIARCLTGRPIVDVVFITNLRDEAERQRYFGNMPPRLGHANGPRIYVNGVASRIRGIYVTAEEMYTRDGRRKAKELFIAATEWAEKKGARVILLAASTKRLFGRDGRELKERFPNLLFTIGDNGTANMLRDDVFRALQAADLPHERSRIMVIGPYGILGSAITEELTEAGYEVIGYGSNASALCEVAAEYGVRVTTDIREAGKVDAVIACTHSSVSKLTPEQVELLRFPGRKLLVVDVAEPANLDIDAYDRCRDLVVRQDAGNAFSSGLRYVLGAISWRMLMLSRGTVFGCFAEALTLHHAIHLQGRADLRERDWFAVNRDNMQAISTAFAEIGFSVPEPRCFGAPVAGFSLDPAWFQCECGMTMPNVLPTPGLESTVSR